MPLLAILGMVLGLVGIFVQQANFHRVPKIVRLTLSFVSIALFFGSVAVGMTVKGDREEAALRAELDADRARMDSSGLRSTFHDPVR